MHGETQREVVREMEEKTEVRGAVKNRTRDAGRENGSVILVLHFLLFHMQFKRRRMSEITERQENGQ